jgi:hypothetical protein
MGFGRRRDASKVCVLLLTVGVNRRGLIYSALGLTHISQATRLASIGLLL